MSGYLIYAMAEAHAAELTEEARQNRLAKQFLDARADCPAPGRLRVSAARLLIAVARRLDDRVRPAPVPAAASGIGP
jgi:hypothetical protein